MQCKSNLIEPISILYKCKVDNFEKQKKLMKMVRAKDLIKEKKILLHYKLNKKLS